MQYFIFWKSQIYFHLILLFSLNRPLMSKNYGACAALFCRNSFLQFLLNCVCRLPVCVSTTHLGLQHDESAIVCRSAKGTKSVMNSSSIHLTHLDLFVAWDLSGAVWPVLTGLRTTPTCLLCSVTLRSSECPMWVAVSGAEQEVQLCQGSGED